MSAINEWFGYYNAIFKYIRDTYGEDELKVYFKHLAATAYSDVTELYRTGGLEAIAERYVANFRKDGDESSATAKIVGDTLTMEVTCPAFTHGVETQNAARSVDSELCGFCHTLNGNILSEAGYDLEHNYDGQGKCVFKIKKFLLQPMVDMHFHCVCLYVALVQDMESLFLIGFYLIR